MRRFCSVVIFHVLLQFAICNFVTKRLTKDIAMPGAELGENIVVVPLEIASHAQPNAATNEKCAKVGEFCVNHEDCCSNACLGFMRRCVSGREVLEDLSIHQLN